MHITYDGSRLPSTKAQDKAFNYLNIEYVSYFAVYVTYRITFQSSISGQLRYWMFTNGSENMQRLNLSGSTTMLTTFVY